MQLLPFDLEKALSGEYKIVTRVDHGIEVKQIVHLNKLKKPFLAVALEYIENDLGIVRKYNLDGRDMHVSDNDLFLIKKPKIRWVNIYKTNEIMTMGTRLYNSKEQAEQMGKHNSIGLESYLKTISIEI